MVQRRGLQYDARSAPAGELLESTESGKKLADALRRREKLAYAEGNVASVPGHQGGAYDSSTKTANVSEGGSLADRAIKTTHELQHLFDDLGIGLGGEGKKVLSLEHDAYQAQNAVTRDLLKHPEHGKTISSRFVELADTKKPERFKEELRAQGRYHNLHEKEVDEFIASKFGEK
jgi:hypothetical protein